MLLALLTRMQDTNNDDRDRSAAVDEVANLLTPYFCKHLQRFPWLADEHERAAVANEIVTRIWLSVDGFAKNAIERTDNLAWGWVHTIAQHTAIDTYRVMTRQKVSLLHVCPEPLYQRHDEDDAHAGGACESLLKALTPEDKDLILFYIQYHDTESDELCQINKQKELEVVLELGLTVGAARKRYERHLAKLRAAFRPPEN